MLQAGKISSKKKLLFPSEKKEEVKKAPPPRELTAQEILSAKNPHFSALVKRLDLVCTNVSQIKKITLEPQNSYTKRAIETAGGDIREFTKVEGKELYYFSYSTPF